LKYLLDTNTWIALLRWQNAGVLAELKQRPASDILLCSVVLAELWFGAERSDLNRRLSNYAVVDSLRAEYTSLPFNDLAAREYAAIRAALAGSGTPIGPNDMMIAAIARSQKISLVTHNTVEFARVSGLLVVDWLSP
jgi:tRNA(fMet)-specific endonuclease VapC